MQYFAGSWVSSMTCANLTTGKEGDSGKVEVGPNAFAKRTDGKDSMGPGVYAMWLEFGLKKKKYPKQPFMRPTFDATAEQATKIFADKLKDDLEAVVKE